MAFNAKNLTYDKSEPAFLRRLKAGYASQDGRDNIQQRRPGKARLKLGGEDGDDDGPVILDESGHVVDKGVFEGMMKGDVDGNENEERKKQQQQPSSVQNVKGNGDQEEQELEVGSTRGTTKQNVVEVGTGRKRKVGKVIGSAENDEHDGNDDKEGVNTEPSTSTTTRNRKIEHKSSDAQKSVSEHDQELKQKQKKVKKKIKLSFDEPE